MLQLLVFISLSFGYAPVFVEINLAVQGGILVDYETSLFTNAKHTFIVSVFHR